MKHVGWIYKTSLISTKDCNRKNIIIEEQINIGQFVSALYCQVKLTVHQKIDTHSNILMFQLKVNKPQEEPCTWKWCCLWHFKKMLVPPLSPGLADHINNNGPNLNFQSAMTDFFVHLVAAENSWEHSIDISPFKLKWLVSTNLWGKYLASSRGQKHNFK